MQRTPKAAIIVALLLVSLIPLSVQAGDSGGVQSSAAQLSLTPQNPVMGGSVDIEVGLYNSALSDAFNVQVAFYKNSISPQNRLLQDEITIVGEEFTTVSVTWNGLTEGVQKVWFEFSAGGDIPVQFNEEFTVQGLPNLRVDSASVDQSQPVYSGDVIDFSALILNSGTVDAAGSNLLLSVPESADVILSTPALTAGSSAWVNTTIIAPSSGIHMIEATPDIDNSIYEASETGKTETVQLVVSSRMDLSFKDGLTVESDPEALEGPWMISGTIVRTNGTGTANIPMVLEINNPLGGVVMGAPFTVQIIGTGYAEQAFSAELNSSTIGSLPDGDHVVTARINPFGESGFEQESTDNDETSGMLTISPIPDVNVDPPLCTACTVQSGDDVEWRITVTNTGDKAVRGYIEYIFDGINGQSPQITLADGEILTWTVSLPTNLGEHEALFSGNWVAAVGSWDDNKQNSKFSTSAQVESKLKLSWEYASLSVVDADNEPAASPLQDGAAYTLSINMTSKETGSANFSCDDGSGNILSTMATTVAVRGDRVSLSCTFTATAAMTTIRFIPEETSIADLFTMSFATMMAADAADDSASSDAGTMRLFGIGALILVGVLVAAVLLTREREEEVERDIFDYCPACDGELEGTEDRCPHCSFNLKKARSQFHDCHECGESIPDLLDNCAYCGAEQDVSSFFEQRQRKERKETVKEMVALPEEEDEDRIVTGTQNFAETVKEFGFDEEHLEEEWDANIEAAEAEVEAAYDRRHAEEVALEDMTDEEIEEYKSQVVTTLKSSRDKSPDHDLEAILASKGELRSLDKDDGELSASDASIRERLFEITGEEGVLPGEKVTVGMTLTDSALAGNEVAEATANFTFDDDDDLPLSGSTKTAEEQREDAKSRKPVRRRSARQRKKDEAEKEVSDPTAECGACGADLPPEADECGTCGARFG